MNNFCDLNSRKAAGNSTYPKGGALCSKDRIEVNHPPRLISNQVLPLVLLRCVLKLPLFG
jgi:hypothetical protein